MSDDNTVQVGWKQKVVNEMAEYWIIFVYLAVFFSVFVTYRRLILEEYQISYLHYGFGVIEAAILAKVILLGDAIRLGRKNEDKPLIVPTLYKTIIFSMWAAGFKVIEELLRGLLHGSGLWGGMRDLLSKGWYEILANAMVMVAALVPFFAMRELGRVLGGKMIRKLFFRSRAAASSDRPFA